MRSCHEVIPLNHPRHFMSQVIRWYDLIHSMRYSTQDQSKKEGKDQESIQSSTTPDPGYRWESDNFTIRHYKQVTNINGPQCEKTRLWRFANNTGADQPAHPRSLISAFVIPILESIISKLANILDSLCS